MLYKRVALSFFFIIVLFLANSCVSKDMDQPDGSDTNLASTTTEEKIELTATPSKPVETTTPTPTSSPTPEPSLTPTITHTPIPACYREKFPPAYEQSAVISGFKRFAEANNLILKYIYFPQNCKIEDVEKDISQLFYRDSLSDGELGLFILDEWNRGILGDLYQHLIMYDFWAMGPEDYSLFFDSGKVVETNIIIFRADRVNGEGTEGNAILSLMEGMAEHEYIHTVQGRNNPKLAEMIWNDPVYRAFIERYANLGNNSGHRYRLASVTMMELLQFLDGLNSQNTLYSKLDALMQERGLDIESYFTESYLLYDKNLAKHIETVGGEKYLNNVKNGKVSPFTLLSWAGSGNLEIYEIVRQLYDENIAQYNQWFYSNRTKEYLPATFDELFSSG